MTACKLLTVAAMLLHSIFGCSLHHACACESHPHGQQQHVAAIEDANACNHADHQHFAEVECAGSCKHHDHANHDQNDTCHGDHRHADDAKTTAKSQLGNGCQCCQETPCENGDSPCCSAVQCSFIIASDVEFTLDVGPILFVLGDDDPSCMESLRARSLVDIGRLLAGHNGSLSMCSLHCSWQI